jgi:mannosyltransferase
VNKRGHYWLLVGVTWLAFVLRVVGLDSQSLWRDEVDAIRFATKPLNGLLHTFIEPGQNGPLYSLLLHPWLILSGQGEFALRFFSVVCGVLAVPLIDRLARRLLPSLPAVGFLAALLMATSPYLVWYGQEGKMYAAVVLVVLLSMERLLVAVERGGWQRWLVYVVVTSAAFYVHLLAALIIPVQGLLFLLLNRQAPRARWKPWLASMAALTLPYLPLLVWQVPLLLQPAATGFPFVPLHEMLFSLFVSYSFGVVQRVIWWTAALFIGLLLAAGLMGKGRGFHGATLAGLVAWLLVPAAGLFLITLIRPLFTARYLIFVVPAYLLLLAVGVTAVAFRSRLIAGLLLLALLAVNGWGVWLQARTPLKTDFRAATRYVAGHLAPGDLILFQIPYGRYSFAYYWQQPGHSNDRGRGDYRVFLPCIAGNGGEPYRWAEGVYTNSGIEPGEVARRMAEITAGSRTVWLVASEAALWDERGLVQGWLDDHATLTDEAQFVQVAVYRYTLP